MTKRSLALIYDVLKIGWKRMTDRLNELISDEGVSRTSKTTPGLLNTEHYSTVQYTRVQ